MHTIEKPMLNDPKETTIAMVTMKGVKRILRSFSYCAAGEEAVLMTIIFGWI